MFDLLNLAIQHHPYERTHPTMDTPTDSQSPNCEGTAQPDATHAAPPEQMITAIGLRIKAVRAGRMSVKQLSGASGVSVGLISEIERGKGNPSFKTLHSLARALDLQLGDLIDSRPDVAVAGLVRRDARKRLGVGPHGPIWELLSPNLQGKLEVLETTLPDGFSNENSPFQHVGEECVVIQHGAVEINVGGVSHVLDAGDAITYDANIPHWYRNTSGEDAVVLGAVTPPSF
jgi:transcriptional regulator with XRE-family HTH domain